LGLRRGGSRDLRSAGMLRCLDCAYRRFETEYRYHPQGSGSTSPWDMGPLDYPERSVTKYQTTLHNVTKVGSAPKYEKA